MDRCSIVHESAAAIVPPLRVTRRISFTAALAFDTKFRTSCAAVPEAAKLRGFFCCSASVALLIDFRLDELRQVSQRLLPTEIASLRRNGIRQAFLHDV